MSVRSFCRSCEDPMTELDVAVAGALGLAEAQNEGLVADAVEFAGDGLRR